MARLWSCGFELQSVTAGVEFDSITGTGITVDTTTKRSGAASLNITRGSNGTSYINHRYTDGDVIYVRFYLYITTSHTTNDSCFHLVNSANFPVCGLNLKTDDTLRLAYLNGSDVWTEVGTASGALSKNTWYLVEYTADHSAGNTSVTHAFKVNGSLIDTEAVTVFNDSTTLFRSAEFGIAVFNGAGQGNLNFDDIAVNDDAGTVQNSYPGAGQIVHIYPTAAGDIDETLETPNGYLNVDETPTPDDATSYVQFDANNDDFFVRCQDPTTRGMGTADTITLVQVGCRHRDASATGASVFTPQIKSASGGSIATGSSLGDPGTAWRTNGGALPRIYKLTSYTDPATGSAWTVTGVNSLTNMQIGGVATDATPNVWLTSTWALVEATSLNPAVGSTSVYGWKTLLGVGN